MTVLKRHLLLSSVTGSTRVFIGLSKKFHDSEDSKLGMATMFLDYYPSTRNLNATEGRSPVLYLVRFLVSERRIMISSDPVAYIPVYGFSLACHLTLATTP